MKRNIYAVLILTLALGLFAAPALAAGIDPEAVSLHSAQTWLHVIAAETLYLPPGSAIDTSKIVVGQPYAGFWLFAVADSWKGTSAITQTFEYRARVKYPGTIDPYWTPWTLVPGPVVIMSWDSLVYAPVWGADTLGWFDDLQVRTYDISGSTTDSVALRAWLVKRYRR